MNNSTEIGRLALRSSIWALLANLFPALVTPLLTIILARLLTPDDYGVVGIGSLVLALLVMLQQFGLGPALIQRGDRIEHAANAAFWLSVALGIVLYIFLWMLAPFVAEFYRENRITDLLRVLGFHLVLSSFAVVPSALLQRQFRNKSLFLTQSIASVIPFVVSVPMALKGMGYWALVWGTLAGSAMRTVLVWYQSRWFPLARFDFAVARQLWGFGSFVLLEALLGWLLIYLDKAVVGKVLGTQALGVYTIAFTIATMAISLPLTAITGVTLPTFSRLQDDRRALRNAYLNGTRLVAAYSIPAGIGLALLSNPIVSLLFGSKWEGLGLILPVLALYSAFGHLWILSGDAFKAIGRPDIMPKMYILIAGYMGFVFLVSAPMGLLIFCIARACVVPTSAPLHTWAVVHYLGLPKWYLLEVIWRPLVASMAMACVVMSLTWAMSGIPLLLMIAASIAAGCTIYIAILWLIDRALIDLVSRSLGRAFGVA